MNFEPIHIKATTIPDAWFQCLYQILEHGFRYVIQQGSFVGQTRCELDWIELTIRQPYEVDTEKTYNPMIPDIPESMKSIPAPLTLEEFHRYIPYIMTNSLADNEQYTYGERIWGRRTYDEDLGGYIKLDQIALLLLLLDETPNTNQAIIQIAQPSDIKLKDPPCLRHIDIRVKDGYLIFYPYFRSWDLWAGLPANLAAIAVLQQYMAESLQLRVGPMQATSKGLHLYGYAESLAKIRTGIVTRKSSKIED